ncbi:CitMHS family transporter [Enterococcus sp. HY326]|uniref:CitMHS family transporter n=1 Tax=Enterococcus sp. HY326 TaxID=2971265 RepID=UPI002240CC91|nr:citrate:proton symporter [Enterococcus sp. HY326]
MLAIWGIITIVVLLLLIMSKKMIPVMALIIVPVLTALFAGFGPQLGEFMLDGIQSISGTGVMFIFAVLFFGVLNDAGTFDPIIRGILKVVGKDPVKIAVGMAILAMFIHLDGSGAVTFLVVVPAFLPIFEKLNMRRSTLATIVAIAAGANILPWSGPVIRAASALEADSPMSFYGTMFIPVCIGMVAAIVISGYLGLREKRRLIAEGGFEEIEFDHTEFSTASEFARPKMFIPNLILIIVAIATIISGVLPPAAVFMIAFCLALLVNYRTPAEQNQRIKAHGNEALTMASVLFAAGSFTGIMTNSGMITAMADGLVSIVPASMAGSLPLVVGILAMPMSLLFDPDSFYFGILPVLASTAAQVGVDPLSVGHAAIVGQMTTGFPISPLTPATFLLIGLVGIDLGEHQRKTIPWAYLVSIIILVSGLITGAI